MKECLNLDEICNGTMGALVLMVVLGAARKILTKLFFQLGFDDPYFVTMLYMLGQSVALPIYLSPKARIKTIEEEIEITFTNDTEHNDAKLFRPMWDKGLSETIPIELDSNNEEESDEEDMEADYASDTVNGHVAETKIECIEEGIVTEDTPSMDSDHSGVELHWTDRLPLWAKLIPSSFLRLLGTVFLSLSTLFLAAALSSMLTNGLEIILSVFAKRFIRRKEVSASKWYGVAILTVGIALIGASDLFSEKRPETASSENFTLGIICVILKSSSRVTADFIDEYFMHDTKVPPMLMLGASSVYGFWMFLPLYLFIGPKLGYVPMNSFLTVFDSFRSVMITFLLLVAIFLAGIYSIMVTFRTCVLTKNMFKGFRGLFVWIFGLTIFYSTSNDALGEAWLLPASPMILTGFAIMMVGIYAYSKQHDTSTETPLQERKCSWISLGP